jgi:hypothetical protein
MIPYVLAVLAWLLIFGVAWCWMVSAARADRWSERELNEQRMRRRLDRRHARENSPVRGGGGFRG